MLGKVPGSIYYRVLKQGSAFALIYGSQWSKDGVHNKGDGHVPKREHITLDSEDIARLTQILVDYGIEPLEGGAMTTPSFGSALYFSPIDVDERIGRALVRTIFLKYGALDAGTYADAVALRAATSRTLSDVETIATNLAHVQSIGRTYAWSVTDARPDDGVTVIQPDDRPTSAGRWVAAPFRDFRGPYFLARAGMRRPCGSSRASRG